MVFFADLPVPADGFSTPRSRMNRARTFILCLLGLFTLCAGSAEAQLVPGFETQKSWRIEQIDKNHLKLIGQVEIQRSDVKFFADEVEMFIDSGRLIASGNVVYVTGGNQISADRVEFNTKTGRGTFYHATGIASLGPQADRSMFGTQEPDVYFYGETVEKIGTQKYRITTGGFTTCVQPTPRWELTSSSVVINLDHYAVLKNSLMRVKGVPVFYLPVFYYPIQEDDRATGFLIPSYGASTIRGQSVSNAFFWAIDRSQDATIFHDWFSNTGQGAGAEYRYVLEQGSEGTFRTYFLNEHEAAFPGFGGTGPIVVPARRSYEIRGNVNQALGHGLRARGRADYFSDITVQQTFFTNIFDASRRQRTYNGSLSGTWGAYSLNGIFERSEFFFGTTSSTVTGGAPRISANRAERPIRGSPLYVSLGGEYARLVREAKSGTVATDSGLSRVDFSPRIRFPLTKWQFLTVNSSVSWRNTYYTESRDEGGNQIEQPISRRYFEFQSQIVGPIFNRVWDTPKNGYAEKFKHSIEPFYTFQRISAIDNFDRIVQLDSVDSVIGSSTRIGYGLNNRVFAKRKEGGGPARAREVVNVSISQSYHSDARAAQFDRLFRTSFSGTPPNHFSPVAIAVRATPTNTINATLRAEIDSQFKKLRTIGADGTLNHGTWLQIVAGWSQRRFIAGLPGFDDRRRLDHFLSNTTTVRTPDNRVGGTYSFNYDVLRSSFLQQRFLGYYNAQCCGFAVEYQTFDFGGLGSRAPVPRDRRFNVSFTLAGIGTFANFFGALSGAPR